MPTVRVRLPRAFGTVGSISAPSSPHPHVKLVGESGIEVTLPLAPKLTHAGLALRFDEFDRQGRVPLLVRNGPSARVYSAEILLVGRNKTNDALDINEPVERQLQILRSLARTGERVRWVNFGQSEGGWFRITQYDVSDEKREHGSNNITVATVSLELTQASDAVMHVGPLTGGVKP